MDSKQRTLAEKMAIKLAAQSKRDQKYKAQSEKAKADEEKMRLKLELLKKRREYLEGGVPREDNIKETGKEVKKEEAEPEDPVTEEVDVESGDDAPEPKKPIIRKPVVKKPVVKKPAAKKPKVKVPEPEYEEEDDQDGGAPLESYDPPQRAQQYYHPQVPQNTQYWAQQNSNYVDDNW